jgi:hypothetical protein
MKPRKGIVVLGLALVVVVAALSLCAEEGYWKFTGERFVKGKPFLVGPNDPTKVEAAGGGSAINTVYTQRTYRSVVAFSWTADSGLAVLKPKTKITFTGLLTHSGDPAGTAGITLQPYGQPPGTGHSSGRVIVAGLVNVVGRSEKRSGVLDVPPGPLYPDKKMELRFEASAGGATSALYRTYEWIAGKDQPGYGGTDQVAKRLMAEFERLVRQVEPKEIIARKTFTRDGQTTEMTVTFWNFGGIIPGKQKARIRVKLTAGIGGKPVIGETEAEFTGGPNGQFWIKEEGMRTRMVLRDGRVIVGGQAGEENDEIPVVTRGAFADWPSDVRNLNDYLSKVESMSKLSRTIANLLKGATDNTRSIIANYR